MSKSVLTDLLFIGLVVFLNIYFLFPIFQGGYTGFPLSIESVFLAEAKFIVSNFPHLSWYPFWYFGLPFALVYQPIPIFLTAGVSSLSSLSVETVYRFLTGFFLVLGPIGAYFWSYYLTKNRVSGLVSAIAFSFLPSIAYAFLHESWQSFGLIPLKLVNGIVYGEGPHIWGLALLPFACLFWQRLLRSPKNRLDLLASVFLIAAILLTSLTAFVGLIVFIFTIFIFESTADNFRQKLFTAITTISFSIGLSLFWYNPSFIKAAFDYSFGDGGGVFTGIWTVTIFRLFALPALIFLVFYFFNFLHQKLDKTKLSLILPVSFFIFLLVEIYTWFRGSVAFFPLPFRTIPRLIPELELAFALLLGAIPLIYSVTKRRVVSVAVLGVILYFFLIGKSAVWDLTKANDSFKTTSEYVISQKLKALNTQRAYLTGTHAFWLNLFSDTFQLRGGKGGDFGGLNPWWAHLSYLFNKNPDSILTELWLENLGFDYIVVNYPATKVYYRDFDNLQRFNKYQPVFEYHGDKILKLPTENIAMAFTVPKGWSKTIVTPTDLTSGTIVLDRDRAEKYHNATELQSQPLTIEFPYGSWSRMRIPGGQLSGDKEVVIRQTYYPGWTARSKSGKLILAADPIGFINIKNPGQEDIILNYSLPLSVWVSVFFSLVTLVVLIVYLRQWPKPHLVSSARVTA